MSQISLLEQPEIPACRWNGTVQLCAGPPTALPHDIPLPADPDGVRTQRHYSGHHADVGDSPAKCGICAAIVAHVNDCPPCQASLIRCIRRDDCLRAWDPFIHLIHLFAAVLAGRLHGLTPADVDEAREVAEEKGMNLIRIHRSLDPLVVVAGGRGRLKSWLWTSIWKAMLSHVRKSKPGTVITVDPQPEGQGDDGGHGKAESTVLDTTAHTPGVDVQWRDPTGDAVANSDAVAGLNRLIADYRDSLDEAHRFVFERWYASRVGGTGPTQQQISRDLQASLAVPWKQYTISRTVIPGFKADLDRLFADPANGLDDATRALAGEVFTDGHPDGRKDSAADAAPFGDAQDTTEELEDNDE